MVLHYRIHRSPSLLLILRQMNPFYVLPFCSYISSLIFASYTLPVSRGDSVIQVLFPYTTWVGVIDSVFKHNMTTASLLTAILQCRHKKCILCVMLRYLIVNNVKIMKDEKMFLWRIYFAGKNKTSLDIHVKCLIVLPHFNQI